MPFELTAKPESRPAESDPESSLTASTQTSRCLGGRGSDERLVLLWDPLAPHLLVHAHVPVAEVDNLRLEQRVRRGQRMKGDHVAPEVVSSCDRTPVCFPLMM